MPSSITITATMAEMSAMPVPISQRRPAIRSLRWVSIAAFSLKDM
jgi:hypothetical protein